MKGTRGGQQPVAAPRAGHGQGGFTLFELVVVILVVSILFSYAFNRFRDYPQAAERANFLAVTAQLKSGLNLWVMRGIASGDWSGLEELESSNPMDLLMETPGNYVGEFNAEGEASLPRRVWYFDRSAGELVYLADNKTEVYELRGGRSVPADRIRMRIRVIRENGPSDQQSILQRSVAGMPARENAAGGTTGRAMSDARGSWQGVQLRTARVYAWEGIALEGQDDVRSGSG